MNKQQLANKIWASANKMRSKIDANEYKDYILGLIFYKFLCDNEEQYLRKDGWTDEDMPFLLKTMKMLMQRILLSTVRTISDTLSSISICSVHG